MAKRAKETLELTIQHAACSINAITFSQIISNHIDAIDGISQKASKGRNAVKWHVTSVSMRSPFHMTVQPGTVKGSPLVGWYIKGIRNLENKPERPRNFSNRTLRGVRSLVSENGAVELRSPRYGNCSLANRVRVNIDIIGMKEDLNQNDERDFVLSEPHKGKTKIRGYLARHYNSFQGRPFPIIPAKQTQVPHKMFLRS